MKGNEKAGVLLRLVVLLLLVLMPASRIIAQPPPDPVNWSFSMVGHVTEYDDKKGKDMPLAGVIINVYSGTTLVTTTTTNASGKFKVDVPHDQIYTVNITKPGYITKKIEINTTNVPALRAEGAFAEFDVEIDDFKMYPGLDYSCLDKPIAKIIYNPQVDVDDFDYDKVYTAQIQACIDNLKRLADEARKRQKLYDDAIAAADKLFKASDWANAKAKYNEALGIIAAQQYPIDQVAICDQHLGAVLADQKKYDDAMAEANRLFGIADYANAKLKYQEASAVKPTEQLPKDGITKCDAELLKLADKKKYDDLITQADTKFKASDWTGAKTLYQQAQALRAAETYPPAQIKLCDDNLNKDALDKKYNDAITAADALFKSSDWANAKTKYQEASTLKPAEQYPKDQMNLCDANIKKAGLDKQYNDLITAADGLFKNSDWAGAKDKYTQAGALKPAETYPPAQIKLCDDNIKKAGLDKQYNDLITAADGLFKTSDWTGAKAKYTEASALKTAEQYPKDQIKLCDENIKKAGLDKSYNDAITAADALFKSEDWSGAKAKYQEASTLKPAEQYPKDQMKLCDDNIKKAGVDKSYNDAITKADAKFAASDWAGAKTLYQQASALKADEQYPKDQIVKCDANIKAAADKPYNDLITAADALFASSDWSGAKAKYQAASALKTAEQYPKDQIKLCDANIKTAGVDKSYSDLITKADAKFATSDWAGAKTLYQQASAIKTGEQYPKDQVVKCDANAAAELDKKYNDAITAADALFKSSDWSGAKAKYQEASTIKTAEQYPKDQIALCDANIKKAGVDKTYNDLITKADAKFAASDWAGAKTLYQQASSAKADEQYPKDQITKCDENIKAAKDKPYNDLITAADALFASSDWLGAKAKYQAASALKTTEQYPKDQIKLCNDKITAAGVDKSYNDLIAAADALFSSSDWSGAKAKYQQASAIKTTEQYPKDQIVKCDANAAAELDKKYNDAITAADALFKSSDWSGAKAKYQEASALKTTEQYPKDQIALCDANIKKAGVDKTYNDLITKADAKFAASDWAGAKTLYQQASSAKADEQYPKDQITKCDENIKAAKDKPYNDLITAADALFASSDWSGAKAKYQAASALKTTEQYPKDQIKLCEDNIKKAGVDKSYNDLITKADAKFASSDWAGAKTLYQQASAIKTSEQYPKDQIVKCDANAAAELDKKYSDAITAADALFKSSDWSGAKAKYQEASALKTAEQYPKDQMALCDANIKKAGVDKTYNDLITKADAKFAASDWAGAKTIYQQASAAKADEQYPKDQITKCDANIKAAGLDKTYNDLIVKADAKFKLNDWAGAKTIYQQASDLKTAEQYPKDQISLCDQNIDKAGTDKKYNDLIAAADLLFKGSKWPDAKVKYNEALAVKTAEQYPKDQIALCDAEITKSMTLDAQYDAAVKRGDSAFASNDYETAQSAFLTAKGLKPAETYPPKKLAEINSLLAAQKKDNDYRLLLAKGDSLFGANDLAGAKKIYQSALLQKPTDVYPKNKIDEIDRKVADQKFEADKKAKYDKLIVQADAKFKAKDWKGAKTIYQQALAIEPLEIYPKTQMNACDEALNPKPVVKVDSSKIVGSDQYISELVKTYPKGVTELPQVKDGGADVTKRVVVIGNKGWVYTKKVYSWGTFYFRDDQQITQQTFDYETNSTYVKKQNDTYDAAHPQ